MLRDIQELLEDRRRMSLLEIAIHFDLEPETLEPMMDQLLERGRVRRVPAKPHRGCSGCPSACPAGELAGTVYEAD